MHPGQAVQVSLRLGLLALLLLCATATAAVDEAAFQSDLTNIAKPTSRMIGSEGYTQTVQYVQSTLQSLGSRVEVKRHEYPVIVPKTTSATLTSGGVSSPIYPFWPAGVRLNATPTEGITGRVVYLGEVTPSEIKPALVKGQIAAIEASAGDRWQQAAYFGARAIIVLGSPETTHIDLQSHDLTVPVNVPCFYVPPGALADAIRADKLNAADAATVKAVVNWETVTAVNLYAFIQPSAPAPPGWDHRVPPAAITFSVPLEASGLVPDLANGAGQAVQTAAGLALARELVASPVPRPVLIVFTGADSIQMLGTRNLFMALSDPPAKWQALLDELATNEKLVETQAARLQQVRGRLQTLDPSTDRLLLNRVKKLVETDESHQQEEMFRYRLLTGSELEAAQPKIKALEDRQILLGAVRSAFDQRPAELVLPENRDLADYYVQKALTQLIGSGDHAGLRQNYAARRQQLQQRIDLYQWLASKLNRNSNPSIRSNNSRLLEVLIALDLSEGGVRVGPMFFGSVLRASNISQIQEFGDWMQREQRGGAPWAKAAGDLIDLEPMGNIRPPGSWLATPLAIGTEACGAWGVPGFTMMTLDDLRPRRDTPNDTLAYLPQAKVKDAILPQLQALSGMFRAALNDPKFIGQVELKWNNGVVAGQVVGLSSSRPVPDLPLEGFYVTYNYVNNGNGKIPALKVYPPSVGVRRTELVPTDAEGRYRIEGAPANGDFFNWAIYVYKFAPNTGQVIATSDMGKGGEEIKWFANIREENLMMRSTVFDCAEFSLYGLYDPRYLQQLGELIPLDARRNAEPQKFNFLIRDQMLAGYIEPSMRAVLLFRYGRVGNRLMLLNVDLSKGKSTVGEGAFGYTAAQLNNLGPLALATVRDFAKLDEKRLNDYRKAGVKSDLVDDLHRQAEERIQSADEAFKNNNGAATIADANGAWADEARVYKAAQEMAGDVVRAAIFLLLLCVPFSFCMERLLIGSPSIYKQIGGTAAIFAVMTAALWSFHPAFAISSSPLIIILAFAIIFMSLVVMWVIYGKFDTELKRIRSGRGTSEGASFARASVVMSAVLLGIANMRKRKFRTALTSITIVLITFAVLCFTSASRFVGTAMYPTGVDSSHPGLMLRQRGFRPMPTIVVDNLQAILGDKTSIAQRWWNVNSIDPNEQIHVISGGVGGKPYHLFPAQAVLGVTPAEATVSHMDEVIGKEKFARLTKEKDIVFMSQSIARQLEVKEGDTVKIGGLNLKVATVFSAEAFDRTALGLSGDSLAPLKYTSGALDAGGSRLSDTSEESLDPNADVASTEAAGGTYEHLSSTRFVIVSAEISKMLPNASLRSVALGVMDFKEVEAMADDLTRRFAITTFAGYEDGVKLVTASDLASVSGAGQVAVPLAIAGLIVFNTMMGSIAERRREIHVYTSLGLAPLHVGALFIAEAMTYGLIGVVFGYVIGQGVGTLLLHLGWLGGVTLNYSGTSAMMTMGLILLIVLLSALVPARLASKIAAPSIERSWRVPLPKDDEIKAILPFTINKTAADGALAYLADFFEAHQEGSIGKFSAGKVEAFTFEDDQQRTSRGLKTIIWLTPFDLGVRQQLTLLIHPGEFPEIYEVQVVLKRTSGSDGNWYRMNRTFLTELRKQFLAWRSLSPQRMLDFVEESKRLFAAEVAGVSA
jgi:ABC-type lipoprotein release transport system permease subunit